MRWAWVLLVLAFLAAIPATVNAWLILNSDVLNTSDSMQPGIYHVSHEPVQRGDIVVACPPARFARWAREIGMLGLGPCDGAETVLKRVVGVAGDRVRIDAAGLTVNGNLLAGTAPKAVFNGHVYIHVPYGERVLTEGQFLLAGDERAISWDSRFWGPTNRVIGRATRIGW